MKLKSMKIAAISGAVGTLCLILWQGLFDVPAANSAEPADYPPAQPYKVAPGTWGDLMH